MYAFGDESFVQNVIVHFLEDRLISFSGCDDFSFDVALDGFSHGFIEASDGVMIGLNDFDFFLRFIDHFDNTFFDLFLLEERIVVKKFILVCRIELGIGKE